MTTIKSDEITINKISDEQTIKFLKVLFYLFIFFIPSRILVAGIAFSYSDIVLIVLLLFCASLIAMHAILVPFWIYYNTRFLFRVICIISFALIIGYFNHFLGKVKLNFNDVIPDYFVFILIFLSCIAISIISVSKDFMQRSLKLYAMSITLASIVAFVIEKPVFLENRFAGFMIDANAWGMCVAIGIVISVNYIIHEAKIARKLYYLFCMSILLVSLAFSYSTGSVIGALGGISVSFFAKLYSSLLTKNMKGFLISLIIYFIIFFSINAAIIHFGVLGKLKSVLIDRTVYKETSEGTLLISRRMQYKLGFKMFLENPIIGIGWGGYLAKFQENYHKNIEIHNTYLRILVETGLVGFCLFIMFISHLFYCCAKCLKHYAINDDYIGMSLSNLLLSLLTSFCLFFTTYEATAQRFFWIVCGFIYVLYQMRFLPK